MTNIRVESTSELVFKGKKYRCAVGSNGFTDKPREGDKATPLGSYSLRECWYRTDRLETPETALPLRVIHENDGWCDESTHPQYNHHVKLPFAASHEKLWRDERIYDVIVPIGFNDAPVVAGVGSAIFFHLAKPNYSPTLGCVAVAFEDMLEILRNLSTDSRIEIG